jgi:hypothetical protein
MSTCRTCEADILWARTRAGESIPVDAVPRPDGTLVLHGEPPNRLALPRLPLDSEPFYASHFATCPNADKFRRAKR